MKKPLCELCETRHSTWEPHDVTKVEVTNEVVTKVISIPPETVTKVVPKVGPVTKVVMGRPRKYGSHAERQAAYRARKGPLTPERR